MPTCWFGGLKFVDMAALQFKSKQVKKKKKKKSKQVRRGEVCPPSQLFKTVHFCSDTEYFKKQVTKSKNVGQVLKMT